MTIRVRVMRMMVAAAVGIAALAGLVPGRAHGFEAGVLNATLDTADAMLAARGEVHQRAQLKDSRELLEMLDRPWPDALTGAVALAKASSAAQAHTRAPDASASSMTPTHDSPARAARTLASLYGVDADSELARLDQIAGPVRDAVTELIDAFASVHAAARVAFASVDAVAFQEPAEQMSGRVNLADVFAARSRMLDAVLALRDAIGPGLSATGPCTPIAVPPAFSIDLGSCDNTYTQNFALLADAAGNDRYLNNAGGSNLLACSSLPLLIAGAAALIDLSGDDGYGDPASPRGCGTNGGGYYGAGFLLDVAGNDIYAAGDRGTNGGLFYGAGFLLDADGNDSYSAGHSGTNGGGFEGGASLLLDAAGDDVYTAGDYHTNGGNGLLVDAAGNDSYIAGNLGTNGGGWSGGIGFLLDAAGDDTYTAGSNGTNGGGYTPNAFPGGGFLLDAGGNDTYTAGSDGTNGGGAGDPVWAQISTRTGGRGFLLDATGNDTYTAGRFGTNGWGRSYVEHHLLHGIGWAVGIGLLLDGAGTDSYLDLYDYLSPGERADCTRAPKGAGAQVDLPNVTC